jgi:hypothetical protein
LKKALFLFGLSIVFFASLLWISSTPTSLYRMSFGEFISLITMGGLLTLPQIIVLGQAFLTSGSPGDDPF